MGYLVSSKIRRDEVKGRKIVATTFIPAATTILKERPFVCLATDPSASSSSFYRSNTLTNVERRVLTSSSVFASVSRPDLVCVVLAARTISILRQSRDPIVEQLCGDRIRDGDEKLVSLIKALVMNCSTREEATLYLGGILRKIQCNIFAIADDHNRVIGAGLFPYAAAMNHDCCPNAYQSFDETTGQLTVRTIRPIAFDEEITIAYTDIARPSWWRRSQLLYMYDFYCLCLRCREDDQENEGELQALHESLQDRIKCMDGSCDGVCQMERPSVSSSVAPTRGRSTSLFHLSETEKYFLWIKGRIPRFEVCLVGQQKACVDNQVMSDSFFDLPLPCGDKVAKLHRDVLKSPPTGNVSKTTSSPGVEFRPCFKCKRKPTLNSRVLAEAYAMLAHKRSDDDAVTFLSSLRDSLAPIVPSNHISMIELNRKLFFARIQVLQKAGSESSQWTREAFAELIPAGRTLLAQLSSLYSSITPSEITSRGSNNERVATNRVLHIVEVNVTLDLVDCIIAYDNLTLLRPRAGDAPVAELTEAKVLLQRVLRSLRVSHDIDHSLPKHVQSLLHSF